MLRRPTRISRGRDCVWRIQIHFRRLPTPGGADGVRRSVCRITDSGSAARSPGCRAARTSGPPTTAPWAASASATRRAPPSTPPSAPTESVPSVTAACTVCATVLAGADAAHGRSGDCTALHGATVNCTARHGTALQLHSTARHCTALHCTAVVGCTAQRELQRKMRIRGSRSYSGIVTDVGRVTAIVGRSAEAVPSELRLPVWCVVLGVYPERRELWSFMNDQIRERWTDLEEAERILGSGASPIPGVLGGVIEFAYQSLGETHVPLRPVVVDILVQMFPGPEHTAFVYAIYREHVRRMMRIDPGRVVTRTRSIIGKRDPDLDRHLAALYHRTRMLPACTG